MSINMVCISGNLTRDAELKATAKSHVANFSVAVNERVKDGEEWVDRPSYIDCIMFGDRAVGVSKYLTKGSKVCIHGKLRRSVWEDKEGKTRSKVEVQVIDLDFMSKQSREEPKPEIEFDGKSVSLYEEDVPF